MIRAILRSFDTSDVLRPVDGYTTALIALGHIALGWAVTGALWSLGLPFAAAAAATLGLAAANEVRQWRGAGPLSPSLRLRLLRDHARDLAFYAVGVSALVWPAPSLEHLGLFVLGALGMGREFARAERRKRR